MDLRLLVVVGVIDELVPPDVDLVAVAQEMLDDRVAVDEGAVGAAEVFQKRVVEYGDHGRVLAADGKIGQADVVVGAAADGDALVIERDVDRRAVFEVEDELAHGIAADGIGGGRATLR